MWGTQEERAKGLDYRRFIPTHVGNTTTSATNIYDLSVHPHACGEHCIEIQFVSTKFGSSPRMWGTLLPAMHNSHMLRFIPTHVGNTILHTL